ncbi:hypothetical protein NPIL_263061 [Nephila pilipes]|uniref:Uncharacterized protein n=1 Tax=Nephila pilipes TaxID=299642 RepID=A0A8X6U3Y0_NEPPI|nr:hypothetical protein NPIL_263061 [Nephila pilipes]
MSFYPASLLEIVARLSFCKMVYRNGRDLLLEKYQDESIHSKGGERTTTSEFVTVTQVESCPRLERSNVDLQ